MRPLSELHADLRAALLAAEDTTRFRQAIADAEAAEAREAAAVAQRKAEHIAAEEARIRSDANVLAAAAAERIASTMATLEPPRAPAGAH
jgi:hypothetical protein